MSASLFPLLGLKPILGRTFVSEEDQPGGDRVAVLSHSLWQRRFGSDPGIIGKTLAITGRSFTVIGIMPPGFNYLPEFQSTALPTKQELWVPLAFSPYQMSNRANNFLRLVARLKPGVSLKQAQAEMDAVAHRLQQQYPVTNKGIGVKLEPVHEHLVGNIRSALLLLFGAVGLVLLIACANVANLLLARATGRHKELAIRTALGASRLRLVRQLVTENVLLSLVGGALGLLLALWGIQLLVSFSPANLPRIEEIKIEGRVLSFTMMLSLLTGMILGLAPGLKASQIDLNKSLKEGTGRSTGGLRPQSVLNLLVVSALALILLIGSGLLIRSFTRVLGVDPGFNPEKVLTMWINLPTSKYPKAQQQAAFFQEVLQRIEALFAGGTIGRFGQFPATHWGDSKRDICYRRTSNTAFCRRSSQCQCPHHQPQLLPYYGHSTAQGA